MTTANPIPTGFRNITPYLVVPNSANLLQFLKSAFNATELIAHKNDNGSILHAELKIGDSILEMGEVGNAEKQSLTANIHHYVPNVDAVYQQALNAGATSIYPVTDMPYGERSGGILDPSGNHWYIATSAKGNYVADGYYDINPYLILNNATAFYEFLQNAFAAKPRGKFAGPNGQIQHAAVTIGNSIVELADASDKFPARPSALHYYTEDCDAVFNHAQKHGAKILTPLKDEPYGDRIGGLHDDWGNHWYIATHKEDLS